MVGLKVGVIGVPYPGGIGTVHATSYKNAPLAELVAVCDLVKEKADAAAAHFGVRAYYTVREMLAHEPDLDVVDVSTGGHENGSLHYEPVMQALEAGKHVLVEKPLSNDVNQARE